jgi:hypothetical protein
MESARVPSQSKIKPFGKLLSFIVRVSSFAFRRRGAWRVVRGA